MLHVGMNIADKAALAAELRRVLKPGGVLGIYDVMQGPGGPPHYPVPWAATAETSFLASEAEYRRALEVAGFELRAVRERTAFGVAFFQAMQQRIAERGPPPLGLHLLMGPDAPTKTANMLRSLQEGRVAPTEIVARAK
jgi:SAM-dependent methyltransferase